MVGKMDHDCELVGAIRFERTTTGPPCQCATRLRYAPKGSIFVV